MAITGGVKRVTKGKGVDLLKEVEGALLKVGILAGTGEHISGGGTVAEIYFWNEFGTEDIPARPTLRPALNENLRKYVQIMAKLAAQELRGENQILGLLGAAAVADVQAAIVSLRNPPNADATIDRKGSSNPLIDEGEMRQSVSWGKVDA